MIFSALLSALDERGIVYKTEYSLREHVSFRVPCEASLVLFPTSEQQMCDALAILDASGVRTEILGRGSNVLFADEHFDGAVILTSGLSSFCIDNERVTAACGVGLTPLAASARDASLSGLEFAFGIPASVGGAVFMNAGAYGGEIAEVLIESRAYDRKAGKTVCLRDHEFGYRHSIYADHPEVVCLGATFALKRADRESIDGTMKAHMQARREKQPLEYPSAGSYFKRPQGHFAGKLIEDCGLKGLSVGGACVSEKHAGFLINRGGATIHDILTLENIVRERVQKEFGIMLEREVRLIR